MAIGTALQIPTLKFKNPETFLFRFRFTHFTKKNSILSRDPGPFRRGIKRQCNGNWAVVVVVVINRNY
jgi:hypothetical protein